MSTHWEYHETFCPYCGHECQSYSSDTDIGLCAECDHACSPVPFEELDQHLREEWLEDF